MIKYITYCCLLQDTFIVASAYLILFAKACDSPRDVSHKYSMGAKWILTHLYVISFVLHSTPAENCTVQLNNPE
jgi:hypothetical protein